MKDVAVTFVMPGKYVVHAQFECKVQIVLRIHNFQCGEKGANLKCGSVQYNPVKKVVIFER